MIELRDDEEEEAVVVGRDDRVVDMLEVFEFNADDGVD